MWCWRRRWAQLLRLLLYAQIYSGTGRPDRWLYWSYKKAGKPDSTKYGGFGGIGVENWILQNGGSLINAMQTFLDESTNDNGQEVGFEEFKR